jgi:hypothetical protein
MTGTRGRDDPHSRAAGFATPEAQHLAEQESLLATLTDELIADETEFATDTAELARFRSEYLRRFVPLYESLDRIEAEIARLVASRSPSKDATTRVEEAEARAEESASAARGAIGDAVEVDLEDGPRQIDPSLRELYRTAAKLMHPDTAASDDERARRTRIMAAINEAYERGDAAAIREILESEASRPELVDGSDLGSQLVRTLRRVAQVRRRLSELAEMRRVLEVDPMWQLFSACRDGWNAGDDPLADDEARLRVRIARAQNSLDDLALSFERPVQRRCANNRAESS